MRFRCANSISTFLRSRRDCANASVSARARATSRAASFTFPARWHVRAALCLQWTGATLRHGDQIADRVISADMTGRGQRLARRACIDVAHLVIDEVLTRECAVLALRLVDDRDMRRNPLLV